jgi:UDP-2-acetamido-2,6-beta-L-arabino-hexul-4-ose reductase
MQISLGDLADKIYQYKSMRDNLFLPNFQNVFEKRLYSTYLSYLDKNNYDYRLDIRSDHRGSLAEFIKSPAMGQIFVSRTNPGVTRGDHYHHTKTEKFLVLQGTAVIRFRHIDSEQVIEYLVRGDEYRVLDIPPGYTHSIENIGDEELVTLFWASEIFDQGQPDTYYLPVLGA